MPSKHISPPKAALGECSLCGLIILCRDSTVQICSCHLTTLEVLSASSTETVTNSTVISFCNFVYTSVSQFIFDEMHFFAEYSVTIADNYLGNVGFSKLPSGENYLVMLHTSSVTSAATVACLVPATWLCSPSVFHPVFSRPH